MAKKPEEFRSFLLTLPERRFFRLYRHYLGDFSTPFHKADLASQLEAFLSRPETAQAMRRHLSAVDRRFLSLVSAYPGCGLSDLEQLWDGEPGFLAVAGQLEDRLLLYRGREGDHDTLRLGPAVDAQAWGLGLDALRAGKPAVPLPARPPRYSETLLSAYLMFLKEFPSPGSRKAAAQRDIRFPEGLDFEEIESFLVGLRILDFPEGNRKGAIIHEENWEYLASLEALLRQGIMLGVLSGNDASASGLGTLLSSLPRDRSWSAEELPHLFHGLADSPRGLRRMAEACLRYGVLAENAEGRYQAASNSEAEAVPPVRVASTYELTVERVDLQTGLLLSRVALLKRCDAVLTGVIDKGMFFRALGDGHTALELIEALEQAGGKPLPQNVGFTLNQWAQEFSGAQIIRGIVVQVDEARRHQLEHVGFTADPAVRTVAPGLYIVPEAAWPRLRDLASPAGLNQLPVQEGPTSERRSYWSLRKFPEAEIPPFKALESLPDSQVALPEDLQEFLSSREDGEQKECFLSLWRAGTLLQEAQWERAWAQCAPQEALGMNLPGKLRLVQEALDEGNRVLELRFQDENGQPRETRAVPMGLRKHGPQFFVTYEEAGKRYEVNLSRVALLRSLRTGI